MTIWNDKIIYFYFVLSICIAMEAVHLSGCSNIRPNNDETNSEDDEEEENSSVTHSEEYRTGLDSKSPVSSTISDTEGKTEASDSESSTEGEKGTSDSENLKYSDTPDVGTGTETNRYAHCIDEGVLRCVMSGSAEREICHDGYWVASDPCDDGEICDASDSDYPGSCIDESSVCSGSADRFICFGDTMFECGEDGDVICQQSCLSRQHCLEGLDNGMCAECIPKKEYECDHGDLKVCADNGSGFELYEKCPSADACDADVGVCQAVDACENRSDCSTKLECRKATCESGKCTTEIDVGSLCGDKEEGTEGTCDASGKCVQCYKDDDCEGLNKKKCDPVTKTCVQCVKDNDCDKEGSTCKSNECKEYEPKCGNGILDEGEQCDSGNANLGPCGSDCRAKLCGPQTCIYEDSLYCYCNAQEWCVWNQQEGDDEKWGCVLMCTTDADCYPEAFVGTGYSVKCVSQGCYYTCDPKNGNEDCPADMICRTDKYTGFSGCSI